MRNYVLFMFWFFLLGVVVKLLDLALDHHPRWIKKTAAMAVAEMLYRACFALVAALLLWGTL